MNDNINDRELERLEDELRSPLSAYMTKSPSHEETNALVGILQPELNRVKGTFRPSVFKQCLVQFRHFHWLFWIVSIAVFLMLSLMSPGLMDNEIPLYSVLIPIYVLAGIGYNYRSWNKEMRMVEMATPFPPALLLLIRMMDVLAINVLFGILGSGYLFTEVNTLSFLFVLEWLAPSLLVFGLLAYIMLWKGVRFGFTAALVIWLGSVVGQTFVQTLNSERLESILLALVSSVGFGFLIAAYRKAVKQYRFQM
ncbi:MAG TPA: hypothetical protein VF199_03940 [Bacillales bacterium]